jgi:hypothetical protein
MSAPISPGGFSSTSAIRSEATAMPRRPCSHLGDRAVVRSAISPRARVLEQGAEQVVPSCELLPACHKPPRNRRRGARPDHVDGLREGGLIDEENIALALRDAPRHGHGFGGGGGLVEQRGVGELQAGEVDHHLLVVEQGFQAALGDLGLVGRVGRIPAGVLQHVALDHRRHERAVVALADHRLLQHVLRRHGLQCAASAACSGRAAGRSSGRCRRIVAGTVSPISVRSESVPIEASIAGDGMFAGADVAADEFVAVFEFGQRRGTGVRRACQSVAA